jgi:hypothetical protein
MDQIPAVGIEWSVSLVPSFDVDGPGRNEHGSLPYIWWEDIYLDSQGIASVELTEVVN